MNPGFAALVLALPRCSFWAEAHSLAEGYEKSLQAVCNYLIHRSKEPPPTEPCGNGNDGCADNIEDQLTKTCRPEYGNESACGCSGRWIGREAITRIAPGSSYEDDDVRKDLCLSHGLSDVYKAQMEKYPGILKMYTGFFSGAHHSYPSMNWRQSRASECRHNQDKCPDYDPRARGWFIAAAVGPKNVILVLDVSGSLEGNIILLRRAAKAVIDTLTHVDFLGIVAFSDKVSVWKDELQPADKRNRQDAKTFLDGKQDAGGTDFKIAFEETYLMMKRSYDKGSVTGCKTAIIFFTDGKSDTSPWEGIEKLKQDERNMFVFSYTLGKDANQSVSRRLACDTGGVHQHIEDGGDLSAAMTTYWRVLAGGRDGKQETNEVVWSEPYPDFSLGETISPGLKCQADDGVIGVASLDINKERDPDIFKSDLKNRSTKCPYFTITGDELAAIRNHTCPQDAPVTTSTRRPSAEVASAPGHPLMGVVVVLLASLVITGCERGG